MHIEELREYCIQKELVEEAFPFDEEVLVFKANGKIFLLCGISSQPLRFNVKCDPEKAIELREKHSCVLPGYHMNKLHWNTIVCDGTAPNKLIKEWIDHSYDLILQSTIKKRKPTKKTAAPKEKETAKKPASRKFGQKKKD